MIIRNNTSVTLYASTTVGSYPIPPHSSQTINGTLIEDLPAGLEIMPESAPAESSVRTPANTLKSVVTLSAADIVALDTTPVVLVDAPGPKKMIFPVGILLEGVFNTAPFASGGDLFFYVGASNAYVEASSSLINTVGVADDVVLGTANRLDSASLARWTGNGLNYGTGPTDIAPSLSLDNKPLAMFADATFIAGVSGAVATSSLNTGGTGYAVNDTGTINVGTGASYVVNTIDGVAGRIATSTLNAGGTGYVANDTGTITTGTGGTYIVDTVDGAVGAILTSALNAGGSGYAQGDTGTIVGGTAAYVIDSVNAGAVVTYHLTSAGSAYSTGTGVATATGGAQAGVGVNFTVDISTVAVGAVATYHLTAGGSGYSTGSAVVTATGGAQAGVGTNFKINIATVYLGAVATYSLVSGGSGYSVANNQATTAGGAQAGIGAGLRINILTVAAPTPDTELVVTTLYNIVDLV